MENSHRANVLVTSCLKTPVDPHTKAPLALYEREKTLPYAAEHMGQGERPEETECDSDSDYGDGAGEARNANPLMIKDCRVSGNHINLREFYFSNEEYYRKLEELKRAHLQTMAELEEMYRDKMDIKGTAAQEKECGSPCTAHRLCWTKNHSVSTNLRKAFSAAELNQTAGSGLSDASEDGLADNCGEGDGGKGLLLSPRAQIKKMWQDFTVGELTPRSRHPSCSSVQSQPAEQGSGALKGKSKIRRKRKGVEQCTEAWRPRATVPKPFQMTVREAEKKRTKVKSRSEVELENALLKKQLEELTECQKKFRASPAPAHIYLPLYEVVSQCKEERRHFFRNQNLSVLAVSQKPFSFLERERKKKELKEAQLQVTAPKEEKRCFKAKPVPRSVYDSTVSDRIKEDQLYRAIRMQMRAQELLYSSSMPRSMLAKRLSEKRKDSRERTAERTAEAEADFRPRINGAVPDFDASYRRFQRQLRSKRDVKPMTVCEPFQLRTSQIASHRDRILADIEAERTSPRVNRWPYIGPTRTTSSSLCSSLSGSQELLPAKITDAARRRQEAVRKTLEQRKKAEEDEEQWREKRRERERTLQKLITRRAQANDPHVALSQTCQTKLKQFRKQDLQRRKEYREEMQEIRNRVKERPLLLEQVTQRNAKQAAERRFADALRGYGLSEDFVSRKAPKSRGQLQGQLPDELLDESLGGSSCTWDKQSDGEKDEAGSSVGTESYPDDYPEDYEDFDDRDLKEGLQHEEEDEYDYLKNPEDAERRADQSEQEREGDELPGEEEGQYLGQEDGQEREQWNDEEESRQSCGDNVRTE
ncbi:protein FAM161A [Scleropages formosus]|uniref:protein FAM161A n=1 Tax=Scleropages formosus TaxID=113540 RepID=UPI0010FAA05C|nr:protein FAM161A [Scleropages formosus]